MLWSRQQRAFAVEAHFYKDRSVIAVQRAFRRHFDIPPRNHVPNRKCVLMWNDAFRATGNVYKERKGPPKTEPENT
ncbi:elongation factor P [Trichonephila clavipes]|nr:elongation factor P [Trichonephila clavipes]